MNGVNEVRVVAAVQGRIEKCIVGIRNVSDMLKFP